MRWKAGKTHRPRKNRSEMSVPPMVQLLSKPPPGYKPKDFEKGFATNPQVYVHGRGCVEIRPGQTVVIGTSKFSRLKDGFLLSGPANGVDDSDDDDGPLGTWESEGWDEEEKLEESDDQKFLEDLKVHVADLILNKELEESSDQEDQKVEEVKLVAEELEESDHQKLLEDLKIDVVEYILNKELGDLLDQEDQKVEEVKLVAEELEESDHQKLLEDLKVDVIEYILNKELGDLLDQEDQKVEVEKVAAEELDQKDQILEAKDEKMEKKLVVEELGNSDDDQKILEDSILNKELEEFLDQEDQKVEKKLMVEELEDSDEEQEILEDVKLKTEDSEDSDDDAAPEDDVILDEEFLNWIADIIGNPMFIIISSLLVGVLAFFLYDFMYGLVE